MPTEDITDSAQIADTFLYPLGVAVGDTLQSADATGTSLGVQVADAAAVTTATQTFWQTSEAFADAVLSRDAVAVRVAVDLLGAGQLVDVASFRLGVTLLDRARAVSGVQSMYHAVQLLADALSARDVVSYGDVADIADGVTGTDTLLAALTRFAQVADAATAADTTDATLHVAVVLADTAAVEDASTVLAHLLADIQDYADAWVSFKFADESYTGWVMNAEGERPLSEYQGFNFNSFAEIGGRYYGAADDGLYLLEGADDAGAPIDASIKTMVIDFGSAQQKRVRAAYLGYTASGKLLLKVRAVDGGELKEYWYEAQDLSAQAPREQMVRIGRGLKSRYWQFELANVDGADFELDALELYPVVLNRRV